MPKLFDSDQIQVFKDFLTALPRHISAFNKHHAEFEANKAQIDQLKSVAASLAGASQAFQDTITQDNLLSSEEAHLEAQLAQVGIKRTLLKQEQSTIKANMQNFLLTQAENGPANIKSAQATL